MIDDEFEDIHPVRVFVLLTKMMASAYITASIGVGLINAAMKLGGFH